jgi:cyclopropane fatty-acyl-phospholipid synthase-like methyltransferase
LVFGSKLCLSRGETHLDIGCGWGTLVNHSVSKHCTVATGVTLSKNQTTYAAAKSKKIHGGHNHRTVFWCRDYRDIPTNIGITYNKISCIEMAEHVGIKNFLTFLRQVGAGYMYTHFECRTE